jgi:hypothetical protein
MTRKISLLGLAVLLLAPMSASAQMVDAAAASGGASVSAAAGASVRAPMAIGSLPIAAPSLSIQTPSFVPSFSPVPSPSALNALPAASLPAAAAPAAALKAAPAAAAADGPTPLQEPLRRGERSVHSDPRMDTGDAMVHDGPRGRWLVPLSSFERPVEPEGWRTSRSRSNRLFDGENSAAPSIGDAPVAGGLSSPHAASVLEKSAPAAPIAKAGVPAAPRVSTAKSWAKKALFALALLVLTPAAAMAAPVGGPVITATTALSYLSGLQPLAAAAGAVIGAMFGMFAARPKDGSSVSAGEVFSSILRYGILGGAGVYVLLDVTHMAFAGAASSPLQPITTAIATAALGRTAFQDKFTDPATSSADRITGAFPAAAAAVGISVASVMGILAVPTLAATLFTRAMAVTGVATALFAAIYKPGRSPAEGPAQMAKGYVLQALMMGLALAMTSSNLFWIFAAMGAAGFGLVLWAAGRELWSFIPGGPSQPQPPAPPVKKDPPTAPPAGTGAGSTKNLIEQ